MDGRARAAGEEAIAIIGYLVDANKTLCGIALVSEREGFGQIHRTSGGVSRPEHPDRTGRSAR